MTYEYYCPISKKYLGFKCGDNLVCLGSMKSCNRKRPIKKLFKRVLTGYMNLKSGVDEGNFGKYNHYVEINIFKKRNIYRFGYRKEKKVKLTIEELGG